MTVFEVINKEKKQKKSLQSTTMFLIFWDFLVVKEILLSPQVKQSVIISNKVVCTNCVTSYQVT